MTSHPEPPAPGEYILGLDLGGSSIKAVTITFEGDLLSQRNLEFDTDRQMDWAIQIRQLISQLQAERGSPASSIGLSAPGLANSDARSIAHMPGRLQGLEGLDWTGFLNASRVVPVLNDGHAALLGEVWVGAAVGARNVLLLTLGTGVGGAAMVDGRLLRGQIGRAGHLGHICLDQEGASDITGIPGSLELMIGNCSIVERSGGRFKSTHDLLAAHQAGDAEATRVWLRSLKALACAIASFINILDPGTVIIGGGIARAGAALFDPLESLLRPIEWPPGGHRVKLVPAKLGEFAGALGAAYNARQGR